MYPQAIVVLVIICLAGARVATADQITADEIPDTADSVWGSGMTYVPPSDLSSWFFDSSGPAALPESDPLQIWTSPVNIATLNEWLTLAEDLSGDPSLLQEMYAAGMIDASAVGGVAASRAPVDPAQGAQNQDSGGVREPMSLWLVAGGLAAGFLRRCSGAAIHILFDRGA